MSTFDLFKKNVIQWAKDRAILDYQTECAAALKFGEEAGEILAACAKMDRDLLVDAVGDTLVTLVILCEIQKIDLDEAMVVAWNEIKDRKGSLTQDGIFVKE